MLKREFFEAKKAELMELGKLSHGFTGRIKEKTGKVFTNRFFKSDQPTEENVTQVLDSAIEYFAENLDSEAVILERKRQLVLAYRREFG